MASEIRVNKLNSQTGVGTITLSPTGVDISGITTAETLKATTGIVTTLTATTGIVTTFEATTGDITTLRAPTGIVTSLEATTGDITTLRAPTGIVTSFVTNTAKVGGGVTISESGIEASGIGITCANINGTQIGGRRNIIINGAMNIAQRGTSSTQDDIKTVDRFAKGESGTDESLTQAQVNVASGTTPYTLGFRKAFKITNGNQTSGAGTADQANIGYKFEAQDIANCGWNYLSSTSYITFSYWVKSSVAQNFYNTFGTNDGTSQRYVTETGSLSADTWTKITKTIPGNSNLTFNNDNGEGLEITWECYRGTSQTGTRPLNAWAAADNNTRTPDQTSTWWTTNDATFEITGVQLEVGNVATDFEHRSFGQELALCQRYFQKYIHSANEACIATGLIWTGTQVRTPFMFLKEMRTAPSFTSSTASNFQAANGDQSRTASALSLSRICKTHAIIIMTTSSGLTQSNPIFMDNANNGGTDSFFALDSEL